MSAKILDDDKLLIDASSIEQVDQYITANNFKTKMKEFESYLDENSLH